MSGGRMPNCPASAAQGFSSTPVKSNQRTDLHVSKDMDDGVLSDEEDTFSLLSPIYHDSFDSDEDLEPCPAQQTSPRLSVSPVRCELPRTPSLQMCSGPVEPPGSSPLSAWETWLVNKAKEDRLKLGKLAEEEWLQKERKEQQEKEKEQKKIVMEEKIHEWLKMKREQEKTKQLLKLNKKEEEMQKQREKRKEVEQKSQQKYKDWLHKKNQEKIEKEKKEKEEAALKEEQERERHQRAQEKFNAWLQKSNERSRASPKSPCYPTGPYDKCYPSPSFYNPIPWKPIHVPPPEQPPNKKPVKKQRKCQQKPSATFRGSAQLLQRR